LRKRFCEEYELSEYDASVLTASRDIADYYCELAEICPDKKLAANWVTGELSAAMKEDEAMTFAAAPVRPKDLAAIIERISKGVVNNKGAKQLFTEIWTNGSADIDSLIEKLGLKQISDTGALEAIVDEVIANNPKSVEEFKAGKEKALNALVGQCMKATRGKGNPSQLNELLRKKLA